MAKQARRAAGVGALPDDLLRDVLARVPGHVDIFRCAGVCRRWLRLIADPDFLRRAGVLPDDVPDTSFVAGAFYQDAYIFSRTEEAMSKWKCSQYPPKFKRLYPWPAADWPLRFLVPNSNGVFDYAKWPFNDTMRPNASWPLRFLAPNRDGLFNKALPLASRRGLLLLRVLPAPLDWRKLHLLVCDPLTGRRRRVPPLTLFANPELRCTDVTGYAILTDADDDQDHRPQQRSAFKVLFTAKNADDGLVYAYSYSSATDSWSAPIRCPRRVSRLTMSGPRAGVVARGGTVYWLYRSKTHFYALGVTADATDVSLEKIPIQVDRHALRLQPPFPCVAGGKLAFAVVDRQTSGTVDLWIKHDDDLDPEGQWTHSNIMSKGGQEIKIFAFAEGRGALLVHHGNTLFTLNLDNKIMEPQKRKWGKKRLCSRRSNKCGGYYSCQVCSYNSHVLYEMDWPSYILHLSDGMLGGTMRELRKWLKWRTSSSGEGDPPKKRLTM